MQSRYLSRPYFPRSIFASLCPGSHFELPDLLFSSLLRNVLITFKGRSKNLFFRCSKAVLRLLIANSLGFSLPFISICTAAQREKAVVDFSKPDHELSNRYPVYSPPINFHNVWAIKVQNIDSLPRPTPSSCRRSRQYQTAYSWWSSSVGTQLPPGCFTRWLSLHRGVIYAS